MDGCVPEEEPDERDVESRANCCRAIGLALDTLFGRGAGGGSGGGGAAGQGEAAAVAGVAAAGGRCGLGAGGGERDAAYCGEPSEEGAELIRSKVGGEDGGDTLVLATLTARFLHDQDKSKPAHEIMVMRGVAGSRTTRPFSLVSGSIQQRAGGNDPCAFSMCAPPGAAQPALLAGGLHHRQPRGRGQLGAGGGHGRHGARGGAGGGGAAAGAARRGAARWLGRCRARSSWGRALAVAGTTGGRNQLLGRLFVC